MARLLSLSLAVLALAALAYMAAPAARVPACERILQKVGESATVRTRFWNRTRRVNVLGTVDGKDTPRPFAFGFDAELWHVQDMIRLSSLDARGKRETEAALRRRGLVYNVDQLKPWLGVQTNEEVRERLRPSARNQPNWTLLDLQPTYLRQIQHDSSQKNPYGTALREVMQETFDRKKIPVKVGWEGSSGATSQGVLGGGSTIELEMNGSTTSPKEFRELIKEFLYGNADYPETHFHMSVPIEATSAHHVMMAARALEMKITLDELMANLEYDGSLSPYDNSALAAAAPLKMKKAGVGRGVVRVEGERWEEPVAADDIEFRQWIDADHALDNMRFMMSLIENADRLRNTSRFKGTYIGGLSPANLHNSLGYAAFLLKDRLPARKQPIVKQLLKFQTEIKNAKEVTPEKRREIAKYLREQEVMKLITLETFLEPGE